MAFTLYIVATPIGNLKDISERARQVLSSVPIVLSEDTRRTRILMSHLGISPQLISYHHHTSLARLKSILDLLVKHDMALVSDAGTPGINDPGGKLVAEAMRRFGEELRVVPVPGPCALVVAASVSGFPMDEFTFMGFPPHKKGRQNFFNQVAATSGSVVFYESPHRIVKALTALSERDPERLILVARELTKQFETLYRGSAISLAARLSSNPPPGEYVVVVSPRSYKE
ncbi:16S rRNA (cytidine(1402)-2'-O)-methyltransferase [Candidatus Uhrbacteria bacterium RIFCSPLOWO2_12_FULL_46_10]|uniref:Ribosomal RNA small subunit methyltransferase I n=1 Tax=Candidatus Uhrbacteria bacterium RIFCSPLOWO2_01_FULL_47_25 TaxID=1802402 RepID=A0A1F7UWX2_9BACT|nr:MAG: Ribosomal RNA small subunit methyltransferase I [Parcubacteria group bacterium GW2011_GWA2_46_9]OGL69950.1 MAG: 16S rRNA (cytidine(1402)-2'-O)-methyltransferase [Candidatus Uhrbacteria bacterium RIFCSPHIGHO2_02_FULL_47_29]OGL76456.1 MAG: 16S rRNA (cytidine(1402)-2'-O)-methyltransferase [Candidatus Uhrbacteria bacterium RIFCSPHIGHO2_12_FULL_46_13]OGL82137.1 MAG: 16S rRNA (cytidine(1402)-2'-O)-methyltransferase [Candidatus Uhrbacteria bacterium RIFCSPLOWO2_01_FULL_47_25]OGL86639.1 MAG: 16